MATVRTSKKFSLNISDAWRSAFMAIAVPVIVYIQDWVDHDTEFNWKLVFKIAIGSALAYLIKNFAIEPPKVITTTDTNTKAENATAKIKDVV
jgi:hypothetical protein